MIHDLIWPVAIAFAVVVLIGSGLLIRSFIRLRTASPGFDSSGVLTLRIPLAGGRNSSPERRVAFTDLVIGRIAGLKEEASNAVRHRGRIVASDHLGPSTASPTASASSSTGSRSAPAERSRSTAMTTRSDSWIGISGEPCRCERTRMPAKKRASWWGSPPAAAIAWRDSSSGSIACRASA